MKKNNYRMSIFLLSAIFVLLVVPPGFGAGNGAIKGVIKDAITKEILAGTSVFIPSLKIGASSLVNGTYKIEKVPAGEYEIVVKYIGFKDTKKNVTVANNETVELDFEIYPSAVQLNEVIVTGQGIATERRKLTSPVETLRLEEIQNAPVESIDQLLQGRIAGLNSFSSSGMPGTAGRMSTRGLKSVVSKGTPVIYVDNVRVDNQEAYRLAINTGGAESSSLADLVVGEIDRVEVIKGGASATLFGSEAANGVIQIFTKKGIPGAPKWSVTATTGFDEPYTKFVSEQYIKDKVLKTGAYQAYSLNVTGGSQAFTYNVGGKTNLSRGILLNDMGSSKSYNLNAGFRAVLSENANVELSSSYTNYQYKRADNNNLPTAPYGGFEDYSRSNENGYTEAMRDSILTIVQMQDTKEKVNRFRTSVNFDITPLPDFTNKFTIGIDYRNSEGRQFAPKKSGDFFGSADGHLTRADREYMTLTMAYAGSYKLPTLAGFIDQNIAFGAQGFRVEDREESATGSSYAIPGTDDFDNASLISASESNRQLFSGGFYIIDQIGLWDKWFIDFGMRADGNSAFGESIGMQYYPKAGIAYNISQEDFYPEFIKTYIGALKLRASWGLTGNFPPPFTRDRTYVANSFLAQTGLAFGNPGNDNLKPEKTASTEIGFEMGLLNDRASLEFNYFYQLTTDALFLVPRDPASGFGMQNTNVGKISNKGIEVTLGAQVFQTEDFSLNAKVSLSTLENNVESLGGAAPFSGAGFVFLPSRVEEGHPVGTFRVNIPIKDADGNYSGKYETKLMGTPYPKQSGNFAINMTIFNNITITALAEFALGHQVINLKKTLRYFNGAPDAVSAVPEGYNFQTASVVWLEDADWVKIREVTLAYRVPASLLKGMTINASLRNIATLGTKTNMLDPELNSFQDNGRASPGGIGYLDVSAPMQLRFGITYSL